MDITNQTKQTVMDEAIALAEEMRAKEHEQDMRNLGTVIHNAIVTAFK